MLCNGRSTQRRTRSAFIGLAALAALPAAAAAHHQPGHQGGPNEGNLSISATSPVVWGRSTTVTGKLTATNPNSGVAVDLQADPYPFEDNGFGTVASGTTDANGDYRLTAKPTSHTRYRAVAKASPPVTSAATTVLVRIRVTFAVSDSTPRAGSLVRFSGTACPEHDGARASIQRRTSTGSYRTVARATLADTGGACSSYARRVRVRSDGVYRVRVESGADADHSTGTSRRIRIDAR
jgi:hypothetical protein